MKNLITTTLFCVVFFLGNQLHAQKLVMENDKITHNDKLRSAIKVSIAPNKDEVRDAWEDFLEDKYDTKIKGNGFFSNKDVMTAKEAQIDMISDKQLDIYMEAVEQNEGTEMYVFASSGYDLHLSPEAAPVEYRGLENLTLDFLENFLGNYYRDQVEDTQELVSNLEDKRKDLREDLNENKEEIADLKSENIELEEKIKAKENDLEEAIAALDTDQNNMNALKMQLSNVENSDNTIFELREGQISYEEKSRPAFIVSMDIEKDDVRDAWEDFLEDKYDLKVKGNRILGKDDVIRAEASDLPVVSDKTLDLYGEVIESGDKTRLSVFGSFGYDMHISPEKFPSEYAGLKNLTMDFVSDFLTNEYQDRVKKSEELLADLRDDKKDMEEKLSENREKIASYEEENIEIKDEFTAKGGELKETTEQLKKHKQKEAALKQKLGEEKGGDTTNEQ